MSFCQTCQADWLERCILSHIWCSYLLVMPQEDWGCWELDPSRNSNYMVSTGMGDDAARSAARVACFLSVVDVESNIEVKRKCAVQLGLDLMVFACWWCVCCCLCRGSGGVAQNLLG